MEQITEHGLTEEEYKMYSQYYTPEEIKGIEQSIKLVHENIESRGAIVTADEYINGSRARAGSYNGIVARSGDILVARKSGGNKAINWIGHAGIVINAGSEVAEFPGYGMNNREIPLKKFFTDNSEIYVIRANNYNHSIAAAQWANDFYDRYPGTATYNIASGPNTENPNYCSKFVWQAYSKGANVSIAPMSSLTPLVPMDIVRAAVGGNVTPTAQITYVP